MGGGEAERRVGYKPCGKDVAVNGNWAWREEWALGVGNRDMGYY